MSELERTTAVSLARSRWRALLPMLAALLCLVVTDVARAAPLGAPPLLVFELARELRHDAPAVSLTNELRQRVNDSAEFALMSDNPSLVLTARAAGCDIKSMRPTSMNEASDRDFDRACMARIGKRLNVERILWGYFFEKQGQLFVKAHLWQKGEDRAKVLPYREGARTLVADRLFRHVAQGGRVGDVRVVAGGVLDEGDLYVEGEAKSIAHFDSTGTELTLPLGPVALELRANGKTLARGRGEVTPGDVREVRLEPPPPPPAPPPSAAPTEPVHAPPALVESGGSWQRPMGFVALGAGALAFGFGVFANARVSSLNDDFASDASLAAYRNGVTSQKDACDAAERNLFSGLPAAATPGEARDHCSSISTWKTLRAASYVGGGVLVVGGAALLLFAPSSEERSAKAAPAGVRWGAAPALGPTFAGASLHASW